MKIDEQSQTGIYDEIDAPHEFISTFIWWAYQDCPNQQFTKLPCGVPVPVFTEPSPDCLKRITDECNELWRMARPFIRSSKGRCNIHPDVDTDSYHVGSCGTNFFFARRGDIFFMEQWPIVERTEFVKYASKFCPMCVRESNGLLEFVEGQDENCHFRK